MVVPPNILKMVDNAVAIYCFFDDYLKAINHKEDLQRKMRDPEIMLIAYLASKYFAGSHQKALKYVSAHGLCKRVLSKSRFSRRLHAIDNLMQTIFENIGESVKELNTTKEYVTDSFPVSVCHNIRIMNNNILPYEPQYRGKCVSKHEYFYGFKIHIIATTNKIPVEFAIVPGSLHDSTGMKALSMNLPSGSRNISDSGYTNYEFEDLMMETEGIWHDTVRKSNSKRNEKPYRTFYKNLTRKVIENVFSQITAWIPRCIHATSINGFILKLKLFIWSFTLDKLVSL